jgi:hypothetical protein
MISDLSESLVGFLKAADRVKKAEESCEYDRGYFIHDEYKQLKYAEEQFIDRLFRRLANYQPKTG